MGLKDLAPHIHPFLCLDLGEGSLLGELRTRCYFPPPFMVPTDPSLKQNPAVPWGVGGSDDRM